MSTCLTLAWLAWRWYKVLTARDEQASEAHATETAQNENSSVQPVEHPAPAAANLAVVAITAPSESEESLEHQHSVWEDESPAAWRLES